MVSNHRRDHNDNVVGRSRPRSSDCDQRNIRCRSLAGCATRDCSIVYFDISGAAFPGARMPHEVRVASVLPAGCRARDPLSRWR
jgi:hypothetical protein